MCGVPECSDLAVRSLLCHSMLVLLTLHTCHASLQEGRIIFDNLSKTIAYTLTHALPEVFPIFLNLALGLPLGEWHVTHTHTQAHTHRHIYKETPFFHARA